MESSRDSDKSFFKHVFNFDNDSKSDILNIIQYALLCLIPIVALNKAMQKYIPEANDQKSSLEISAEVIIQVIVIFIGLLLIHRIITYVPTYSGSDYPEFHIIYIILAVLMIILSLQTKIGEKVTILVDRLLELWNGKTDQKKKKTQGKVKVSQPISGQQVITSNPDQMAMAQSLYGSSTSISSLPINDMSQQSIATSNSIYQQDTTPLIGANSPVMENFSEPMAANSVLGGGAFGNW